MKILIVTGQLAEKTIKNNVKDYSKHELYIKTIPIPIAAFITPNMIIHYLKQKNILNSINTDKSTPVDNLDMIITPGLIRQNTEKIQENLNIPSYKGPSNAADIKLTLDIIGQMSLSTTKAADILIRDKQYQEAMKLINNYKTNTDSIKKLLEKPSNILIKDCPIGNDFPMRVLGEIANAPTLTDDELLNRVNYYISSGADMVDIGMHAGENNPNKAYHMIKLIKDNYNIPLSIDTLNVNEIKKAIDAEVDLVLSLDHGNYKEVLPYLVNNNIPAVIIPTNYSKGWIPKTPDERVKSLEKLDKLCRNINTIADPLLDPINSPSIVNSIIACKQYKERNPNKPLFFGVGNVTELLDADSNGVNALLSGIAMELNVSILFTPEASLKTKNSINELKTASNMMFITKLKNTIPKNLGINLIQLKDSYNKEDMIIDTSHLPHTEAIADGYFKPDRKGSFKIIVEDNVIKAVLYKKMKPIKVITSTTSRAMYEELIREDLVSRLEHAAYLGMELEKAEIALKLNKKYIQDFPIF